MNSRLPTEIVQTLRENGHEAYFVGGCVRDMVMGIEPADYDIATSARPEAVIEIFPRTEPVGVQYGVVLVLSGGVGFEVATFRSDDVYVDGRRPSGVVFTTSKEDVLRRDFTINGLLYDPIESEVIDHVDGMADIERRVVRAIGNPRARFEEDKLRILRAIRFAARPGFSIEDETWVGVRTMAAKINQVSAERIRDELLKILVEGGPARGIGMLEESGLRAAILPELIWTDHIHQCLELIEGRPEAGFAMALLLHECSLKDVDRIVRRLKLSNADAARVRVLVSRQSDFEHVHESATAPLKRFLRIERFADHMELHRLHHAADGGHSPALRFMRKKLEEWSESDLWPEALISGDDLITLGMEPGPSFREILTLIEDEQLEQRIVDRDDALRFLRQRFGAG